MQIALRYGGTVMEGIGVAGLSKQPVAAQFTVLRHAEGVRLDAERLLALYAELGQTGAEQVICTAIEELAVRLSDLQRFAMTRDMLALIRSARLLATLARQIGMRTLAQVADDVAECAAADDTNSLAATVSRLVRIGDRSLTAVWDLQDITV